jgi:hypothetical protein|tara:strand:+ start:5316 stop:7052 length:1737 start_codon:yes stop_codon:yes gene_type:complete
MNKKGGMFNEFLNSNNNANTPVNKKMSIDITRHLTNDERIELKKDLNNGKNINKKMEEMLKRKWNSTNISSLKVSPLKLGFFNAIVNEKFDKKERIDLVPIFNKKPHTRKAIPKTTLEIEIKSIKLYFGRFKVGAEHSLTGKFGEVDPKKKYFMAQIAAHVYDGKANQGITFRVYRNGKIHFSGGILNNNIKQPEQIRKYIVDNFTKGEAFLYTPIVYNNTVGQYNMNGAVSLSGVAQAFRITGKVDYEPELRAALRMQYSGTSYQLFSSGVVQILGVRDEKDMLRGYESGKELAEQLVVMGFLRPSTMNTKSIVKKKEKKVVATNKSTADVMYNMKKNVIKIGKKSCVRFPKPELVAAAKKIGVVNIKGTTTKEKICQMIKERVFGSFMVDNKPCLGYTKAQIVPLAITKGVTVSDNDTVKSICEKLQKPSTPPKMKKAVIAKEKTDAKVVGVMEKRRLTNSAIKSNLNTLYGKKWMNTYRGVMPSLNENVAAIKKRIDVLELKKNKKGLPFKRDVDALKKSTVREWKLMRKKMLNNKLNNLNNNFANELENLLNVESVKKKSPKKKFLKGTKVEEL